MPEILCVLCSCGSHIERPLAIGLGVPSVSPLMLKARSRVPGAVMLSGKLVGVRQRPSDDEAVDCARMLRLFPGLPLFLLAPNAPCVV